MNPHMNKNRGMCNKVNQIISCSDVLEFSNELEFHVFPIPGFSARPSVYMIDVLCFNFEFAKRPATRPNLSHAHFRIRTGGGGVQQSKYPKLPV